MEIIVINWWAIIVAAVASMILGSIWYGPFFGKTWMKIMGTDPNLSPEQKKAMQKGVMPLYFLQFILSIVTLYILAHYIAGWQPKPGAWGGIINGLWIWLGFIMPTIAGGAMWSGKPKNLAWSMFFINAGYNIVLYVIFGAILGGWQ